MLILRSEICQIDAERRFLLSTYSFISQTATEKGAALQLCQIPATYIYIYI